MMQTPREMQAVHVERRISIHIFYNRQKSLIRDAMAHPLSGFLRFYSYDLSHTFAEW